MNDQSMVSRLLRQELVPSVGCTEPAAIAFATAAAAATLDGEVERVEVTADAGTYKNALAVGLPGTTSTGPEMAAAAGAVVARPELVLKTFQAASRRHWDAAHRLVEQQRVHVRHADWREVRIEARVAAGEQVGYAVIRGRHTALLHAGGEPALDNDLPNAASEQLTDADLRDWLDSASALVAAADALDHDDLAWIAHGSRLNRTLAESAVSTLGDAYARIGDPGLAAARGWVTAAVEARMSGTLAPAMTSGGSGNSGITISLAVWAGARALGVTDGTALWRATGLAHLANIAVKTRIGRVGPMCGGAIASAIGVASGLVRLMDGDVDAVDRAIRHVVNTTSGTLCDGAKPGCALKVAGGLAVAFDAARIAMDPRAVLGSAGLAGASAATALERLEQLARGYGTMDRHLIKILQSA